MTIEARTTSVVKVNTEGFFLGVEVPSVTEQNTSSVGMKHPKTDVQTDVHSPTLLTEMGLL
jgi:hypothetical protein